MKNLIKIVGKDMVKNNKVQKMKKPKMRIIYNIANVAFESSRTRGLVTRIRRAKNRRVE